MKSYVISGRDRDNDDCIHFTFVNRKSEEAWDGKEVTFIISPNPQERFIDCYNFIKEYFELLHSMPYVTYTDEDYVFPNMRTNFFAFNKQGTTTYLRNVLKDVLTSCGLKGTDYGSHSLRHGGARHKFIFSIFLYNLEAIRYVAGWTYNSSMVGNEF